MNPPRISIIVAVSRNGVIGRNNALPWRLSEDLKRFKLLTMGKPILMGRKTWESIGRPLPGRRNIVITSQTNYSAEGCEIAHSLEEAIMATQGAEELMIIGGAMLYAEALPLSTQLYWTRVEADMDGDAFFPEMDWGAWKEVERKEVAADEKNEFETTFMVFKRNELAPYWTY